MVSMDLVSFAIFLLLSKNNTYNKFYGAYILAHCLLFAILFISLVIYR